MISGSPGDAFYVYLLALSDSTAFKVGFSCNPLQRALTFSPRYFERFDLRRSLLVRLDGSQEARTLEAEIKRELAADRHACPPWIPVQAGGETEWFDERSWERAQARLHTVDVARRIAVSEFVRLQLAPQVSSFESWARAQAQFIATALSSSVDAHLALRPAQALRDWLDAYRHFGIPLFEDDPAVREFVSTAARQGR